MADRKNNPGTSNRGDEKNPRTDSQGDGLSGSPGDAQSGSRSGSQSGSRSGSPDRSDQSDSSSRDFDRGARNGSNGSAS